MTKKSVKSPGRRRKRSEETLNPVRGESRGVRSKWTIHDDATTMPWCRAGRRRPKEGREGARRPQKQSWSGQSMQQQPDDGVGSCHSSVCVLEEALSCARTGASCVAPPGPCKSAMEHERVITPIDSENNKFYATSKGMRMQESWCNCAVSVRRRPAAEGWSRFPIRRNIVHPSSRHWFIYFCGIDVSATT